MNERVKQVRKALHLSQKEFATKINLTDSAISKIESGRCALTDQTTAAICREFNVDYDWLTTGEGDMFSDLPQTILDELCLQYHLDELDRSIILEYLQLNDETRAILKNHMRNIFRHEN